MLKDKRKWLLVLILVVAAAGGLWWQSTRVPRPWQNITPEQLAQVIVHRNLGLAYLEGFSPQPKTGDQSLLAVKEFQAIERLQPGLSFGFANEAVARLRSLS